MYSLGIVLLAVAVKLASCRPDGASPVSCMSMEPYHIDLSSFSVSEGQTEPSPYSITAMWDKHMRMIRVLVSGATIQGFLIQGRLAKGGPAIGRFINITQNPDAIYQDCSAFSQFGYQSSVTHSKRGYQETMKFYWEPPTNISNRNIKFYATLAQDKNKFWVRQESNSLPLNMEDAPDLPTTTTTKRVFTLPTENGSNAPGTAHVLLQCTVLLFTTLVLLY